MIASLFYASVFTSTLRSAILVTLLPWLILGDGGNASLAGLLAAVLILPGMLVMPLAGAAMDRWGHRTITLVGDAMVIATLAVLVVVFALAALTPGWIIAAGAILSIGRNVAATARKSMVLEIASLSATRLDRISSGRETLFALAFFLAPLATGILLTRSATVVLVIIALSLSVLSLLATVGLPSSIDRAPRAAAPTLPASEVIPYRRLWSTIRLKPLILISTIMASGVGIVLISFQQVLAPTLYAETGTAEQLGFVLSSCALGATVGAALYGLLTRRLPRRTVLLVSLVLSVGGFVGVALQPGHLAMIICGFIVGTGLGLTNPLWVALVVENSPARITGRVFSLQSIVMGVTSGIGAFIAGFVTENSGITAGIVTIVVVWVGFAAFAVLAPGLRSGAIDPEPVPSVTAGHT